MASYAFAAVAGTTLVFDASQDTLTFAAGSAGQLRFQSLGAHVRLFLGTQWVTLHGTTYADLDDANLAFADGSVFRIGTAGDDALAGTAQGDWLDGRVGADTLTGGAGNDTYRIDNAGDTIVETGGGGTDTVQSLLADTTLGANLENLWLLSAGAANGTGNALNNILYAGNSDNMLDGGAGRDTVSYQYATGGVSVWLAPGGAHALGASGSDTLLSIENAIGSVYADALNGNGGANHLNGLVGDDTLYGAAGNDTLLGGAGNDSLRGGAGADLMNGGAGSDVYHVDDGNDVVVESDASTAGGIDRIDTLVDWTLGANIEQGRALGMGPVSLTGNALDNVIYAGLGDETLAGGGGHDTISYALLPDGLPFGVQVYLGLGYAYSQQGGNVQWLSGFEDVVGSAGGDILFGDAQANRIDGWLGSDFLSGGGGTDTLVGGDGDDYYQLDDHDSGDVIVEQAGDAAGSGDYVYFFFAQYVLPDNVEVVRIGLDTGVDFTGNASDNFVYDASGSDTLAGLGGTDTLSFVFAPSEAVDASLVTGVATHSGGTTDVFSGFENLAGSGGDDVLTGDAGNNALGGGQGADTLIGGAGDDSFDGSIGADELTGGAGADHFAFTYATDSQANGGMFDTITDFDVDSGDVIDLSLVVSGNGIGEQDPFVFIGSTAFSADATGQLRYENGILYGSDDADATAEFMIVVTGAPALTAADFIL